MTSDATEYGSPWYQNFWPWFIVVLLGVSVIGSLVSVAIAFRYRDVDVRIRASVEPSPPSVPAVPLAREGRSVGP